MSHWSILGIGCDTTTMETWCSRIRNAWPVSCPICVSTIVIVITGTSAFVQVIGIGTNLSECNLKRWNEQAKWAKKANRRSNRQYLICLNTHFLSISTYMSTRIQPCICRSHSTLTTILWYRSQIERNQATSRPMKHTLQPVTSALRDIVLK